MVLEYESQHLPLSEIAQFCRFLYTSTMVNSSGILWCPGRMMRLKMLFKKPGNWHFQQLGTPKSQCLSRFPVISLYPDAPWCWNSYLHILQNWAIFELNVGVHIPTPWFAYGIVPMILQYFRVCFRRVSHWSSWGSHPKPSSLPVAQRDITVYPTLRFGLVIKCGYPGGHYESGRL